VASSTNISGGGVEVISSGGVVNGASVRGTQVTYGTASGAVVFSGGFEVVSSGGTASGTIVSSGGIDIVFSGGVAGGTIISGGFMEVMSGGSVGGASGTATFAGSGTLQLDDSQHFLGRVGGFQSGTLLDLSDIPFVAGTTTVGFTSATGSGTLTVNDHAGHIANITLLGQFMAGQFNIATDGHGGTIVFDPPVSSSDQTLANTQH
jgi:autotransporter passenger strand-loop-strand repeat protein